MTPSEKNSPKGESETAQKRVRLFSAIEFRKALQTESKTDALLKFLQVLNEANNQDVVCEYLEQGGSCLELLQLLESGVQSIFVFDVVTKILLAISASLPRYQAPAQDACRYLLNDHITLINKMLGLSSSGNERKSVLKLLTVIVTLSTTLAKDVLLKVNFTPANIELLTKNTNETEDVRYFFIRFLTAFIVDGQYPTLMVLLEKKGLLTSIMKGLQFDDADCVCMVMVALKVHILENLLVSKTVKMLTFNTQVVKAIVNLYNWKGKGHVSEASTKKKEISSEVNQLQKSKVSQTVHDFLLTLCTSVKYGVIFRDKTLGLAGKHQNPLMYTVLDSLERPWEHSFASELVVKTVGACPDLARKLWGELKSYLEPRKTIKWLEVLKFAARVLEELRPSCIEFSTSDLSPTQLAQIVQFLVVPTPIIKILIPNNFENQTLKYCVLQLLVKFLKSVNSYVSAAEKWLKPNDYKHFHRLITEHVERNFPHIDIILKDWELRDETKEGEKLVEYTQVDYLKVAFELLELYKKLTPHVVESLNETINLSEFFRKILQISKDAHEIFVQAANLIVLLDATVFLPTNEMFAFVVPILLQFYHTNKDESSRNALFEIYKKTSIFFGCEREIPVWIDSVLNVRYLDEHLGVFIVETFKRAYAASDVEVDGEFFEQINLENVKHALEEIIDGKQIEVVTKHGNLSPVISAAVQNFTEFQSKSVTNYLNCAVVFLLHLQTNIRILQNLLVQSGVFCEDILNYINAITTRINTKGKLLKKVDEFLTVFFTDDFQGYLKSDNPQFDLYPDYTSNLLEITAFHYSQSLTSELLANNCLAFVNHFDSKTKYVRTILSHPAFLDNFNITNSSNATCVNFITNLVKISRKNEIDFYLKDYRQVIESSVFKAFKKLTKATVKESSDSLLLEVLEVFEMEREQCVRILGKVGTVAAYKIFVYCLRRFNKLSEELQIFNPLPDIIVKNLSEFISDLNKQQTNTSELTECFRKYLELFPHDFRNVSEILFESILLKTEFCKESCVLAAFLYRNLEFQNEILQRNIENLCNKKFLLLLILEKLDFSNSHLTNLIFSNINSTIQKILYKPQKAPQYFEKHYAGLVRLLELHFSKEDVVPFVEKVHKFEVSEVFHANLLLVLFLKENSHESNALLTLVHVALGLLKKLSKEEDEANWSKLESIVQVMSIFLEKTETLSLETLLLNESFQLLCKLCLKFGISSKAYLLNLLSQILKKANFHQQHAADLLEMIGSHSAFLELILNEDNPQKKELVSLILLLCEKYPEVLQKSHVPVFLAAYRATLTGADRVLLKLLKLCEQYASTTYFYDFKPFLWGAAAAGHYSVRADANTALWRQPKIGDVFNLLQESFILNTIKYSTGDYEDKRRVYDLEFLLPLFAHLLEPQNPTPIYKFTKSGAMALTVSALGSDNEKIRNAAAFVLYRFNYHQEARQTGKDNVLWLRFVEAICKGAVTLSNNKLNAFTAIFFARASLILTQPYHVMYIPLSNYLVAKSSLNFNTIPELYTLLHSNDVHFKEHRIFLLNVLKDGLKSKEDFEVALRSMAFKLVLELYDSCLSEDVAKILILNCLTNATKIPYAVDLLCSSYGLLPWLHHRVKFLTGDDINKLLPVFISILRNIVKNKTRTVDVDYVACIISHVLDEHLSVVTKESVLLSILDTVSTIFAETPQFLSEVRLKKLVKHVGDKKCDYYLKYDAKFIDVSEKQENSVNGYLRKITLDYLELNRK